MTAARAAIADGRGRFALTTIEVASPGPGEVLVEMRAAGICHTDHASLKWGRPLIMGHEGAGVVTMTGYGVTHVEPGDPVLLNWAIPCGTCFQCIRGDTHLCEVSKPAHVLERSAGHAHAEGTLWRGKPVDRSFNLGTLSALALVRGAAVTKLPEDIPFESACIIGCGVMTGFGSAVNVVSINPADSVVVIGCGGVGLNVLQGARVAGSGRIIAVDSRPSALDNAAVFGATDTILADPADPEMKAVQQRVRELTFGRGADYCFEATSAPALAFLPLLMIRDGGAALQVSGSNEPVIVDPGWFQWDKRYLAPLYGHCRPARDFPRILDLYRRKELLLDELITRTYGLDDLPEAMEDMLAGRNAKGVILF